MKFRVNGAFPDFLAMPHHFVVVGGGIAGVSCAEQVLVGKNANTASPISHLKPAKFDTHSFHVHLRIGFSKPAAFNF